MKTVIASATAFGWCRSKHRSSAQWPRSKASPWTPRWRCACRSAITDRPNRAAKTSETQLEDRLLAEGLFAAAEHDRDSSSAAKRPMLASRTQTATRSHDMTKAAFQDRVNRVRETLNAASSDGQMGRLDSAIGRYGEVEQLLRALIEDDPDDSSHTQMLGSTLYAAGEVRLVRGDAAGAVESLRRAEEAYETLGRFNRPPAELGSLVADVRLRRARALVNLDRAASALVDAQAAVLAYTDRWSGTPNDVIALDVARVLSWSAWVTAVVGDPDLAVAAADAAIRIYLARAADINGHDAAKVLHTPMFALATRLAAAIHFARGRQDVASQAARLASPMADSLPRVARLPAADTMASVLTLGDALAAAKAFDLQADMVSAATEGRIRVPLDRAPPQQALASATRLAKIAERMLSENPNAGLRIALEAHAMFAGASERQVSAMHFRASDSSPPWIALLARAGEASERIGRRELARDFSNWLVGAITGLIPSAPILEGLARSTVREALLWQEGFLSSIGERDGASSCHEALRWFDNNPGAT